MSEDFNKQQKRDLLMIDPRQIVVNTDENPRVDYGDMKALEASIEINGVKDPIKVQKGKDGIVLIHGFRRMTAVNNLLARGVEVARVPCIAVARGYNKDDALFDHFIENSGKNLTPLEEAHLFKSLNDRGFSQAEIAKKIGKTQGAVSHTMRLTQTTKKVQNLINEGVVAATLVQKVIKECDGDQEMVERKLISAVESLEGTKKNKVTESVVKVKRVSKYHKLFSASIDVLREQNVSEKKIAKVQTIMDALEESPEKMAEVIASVL
jgi:ParB family chromosome partitioning protein